MRNEESSTEPSSIETPEIPDGLDACSETPYVPNKSMLEHYEQLIFVFDKMKFAKVTEDSPVEMLDATNEHAVEQLARFVFSHIAASRDEG
ncbi:MAG TPA: hypothetical protein VFB12_06080 [Ktedonobacteraceae bacterium]|nr:hypothetical protein [Ktedonobacteraceae bacterium]